MDEVKKHQSLTIGIDCRLWNQGGVGRYTRNLVFNLLEIDERNTYVLFVLKKDYDSIKYEISNIKYQNRFKIVPVNIHWHSLSEQLRFPRIINREKVDLMHFPYQQSVPIWYGKPFVITIHDLIYHHFVSGQASSSPLWVYGFKMLAYRLVINKSVRKASKIIAVSEFTKRDIVNTLRVKSEKIERIYEAADDLKGEEGIGSSQEKYILYIGNVYPHKNVQTLIRAFKKIAVEHKIKIIFVGNEDPFYKKLKSKIKDLIKLDLVIFDHEADDKKLVDYYKKAICLVRPSFMEGFSLPPLEALANKCLVLASDIPVHREVLGNVVIYFDPNSDADLAGKINLVLNMKEKEKNDIKNKGIKKSEEFSWRETARQTLRVYDSCASSRSV